GDWIRDSGRRPRGWGPRRCRRCCATCRRTPPAGRCSRGWPAAASIRARFSTSRNGVSSASAAALMTQANDEDWIGSHTKTHRISRKDAKTQRRTEQETLFFASLRLCVRPLLLLLPRPRDVKIALLAADRRLALPRDLVPLDLELVVDLDLH